MSRGSVVDRMLARPWIALAIALVVQTVLWVAVQRDIAAADPLIYATYAHDLSAHPANLDAQEALPFVMRLGITLPIAVLYRLFGVSTLVTNLPCLLAALGIMAIAYAAASTPRAKLLAVLFGLVCTPLLIDGRELKADLPAAALMAASILCLSRRDRPRGAWWVAGAVAVWFAAFQMKEVAVWCAPVWIYVVIRDLRDRGARCVVATFAPAAGVGIVLAAGYLALCAMWRGDPLARFTAIQDAASIHTWSLVGHPRDEWIARLVWEPPMLLYRMFGLALVPVVVSPYLVRGRDRIWVIATVTIVLLYWFGSTTTTAYMPLPSDRRMLLPALPGIVVLSALAGDAVLDRIRNRWWRLGLGLAFLIGLVFPHINTVRKRMFEDRPETLAYARLRAEIASTTDRVVIVCGDGRCPMYAAFYLGFEPPPHVAVVTAPAFVAAALPPRARVRLLAHMERGGGDGRDAARRAEALGLAPIVWHPVLRLYDAGDGARLREALARPP